MERYINDAAALLRLIGGADNISSVSHCVTRMRFVLHDSSQADIAAIEALEAVKGTFTQSGQFQVIIGNQVKDFYNAFMGASGIQGVSKEQVKADARQHQSSIQRLVSTLAEIFSPLIPAIVIGGLLLGFRNLLEAVPMISEGVTKITIVEASPFWSGVNDFLWLICEAIFHFLPVGVTWSVTKKMGCTEILGIVLGLTLVSPQLLNAYAVAGSTGADIPVWDFGFAQLQMIGYQAQVIPAMLAAFLFCYLERLFRKLIPQAVSMIFVPLFSLVPAVLLAHAVLGPFGWWVGSGISHIVFSGLTSSINWLFAAVFGFLYAPLVITGLHHMTNAIDLQLMATFDGTNLWPMIALSNIAQGSAVLAIIYLHRGDKRERQVSIPATISCYLGVTEPAIFGINLKYMYPFIAGMLGSAAAGFLSISLGVTAHSIGVGGIPGILAVKAAYWGWFAICMLVAIVLPFVLTCAFERFGVLQKNNTKVNQS